MNGNLKYFVTTPIFYVNGSPHIGHLYSAVIADAVHRLKILQSYGKTVFATGTDEHGTKVQQAAETKKVPVADYCNIVSKEYRSLFQKYNVDFTHFVRTTDEAHKRAVSYFWKSLERNGHIYHGKYCGWYSVSDEAFLTEDLLRDQTGSDGKVYKVSKDLGNSVEWIEEDNFMFRLSSFRNDLLYWLKDEHVVQPSKFHKQLLSWVQDESLLQDVSISRPKKRVHWGILVPGDDKQVIYVWLDALINYLTVAGYPNPEFKSIWPPDTQVIGKDILKFHGIYWPAFLMGAGLDPPKTLLCHSHWIRDQEKMSKSKNNIVDPEERMKRYTASGLRYFLLREGTAHSDANYSDKKVTNILNSELADTLGNLLNRCTGLLVNPKQIFPPFNQEVHNKYCVDDAKKLIEMVTVLPETVTTNFEEYNFYKGINAIILTLHQANFFFQSQKPWELKNDTEKSDHLEAVLHLIMETLRVCGILLQPIIPVLCNNLLNKLNIPISQRMWQNIRPFSWEASKQVDASFLHEEKVVLYQRIQKIKNVA